MDWTRHNKPARDARFAELTCAPSYTQAEASLVTYHNTQPRACQEAGPLGPPGQDLHAALRRGQGRHVTMVDHEGRSCHPIVATTIIQK